MRWIGRWSEKDEEKGEDDNERLVECDAIETPQEIEGLSSRKEGRSILSSREDQQNGEEGSLVKW